MADPNPSRAVPVHVPLDHLVFLRGLFWNERTSRLDEICLRQGVGLEHLRLEADAFGALARGLDAGEIVPTAELRELVAATAARIDERNEYPRVTLEHLALYGLLDRLERGLAGDLQ